MSVEMKPPPNTLLPSISEAMKSALAQLPPGANGALVGIATEKGVNVAVITRLQDSWTVQSWIGKSWGGSVQGGASVMKTW